MSSAVYAYEGSIKFYIIYNYIGIFSKISNASRQIEDNFYMGRYFNIFIAFFFIGFAYFNIFFNTFTCV